MDSNYLNKYLNDNCSEKEKQEIESWLSNPENDEMISMWMKEHWTASANDTQAINDSEKANFSRIRSIVQARIGLVPKPDTKTSKPGLLRFIKTNKPLRYIAAAVIIFSFITNIYFLLPNNKTLDGSKSSVKSSTKHFDIVPPKQTNAVLTLSDGKQIKLDAISQGVLAKQNDISILKNEAGGIVYEGSAANKISFNTISLPKGSTPLRLVLTDGTAIWLNAASSITYPTAFTGSERKVSITGEAYFEVAHNEKMPFYVTHNDMTVRVYGTHFNVSTYQHETSNKVTLLEGSVSVSMGNNQVKLKSGEQADVTNGSIGINKNVNIEEVMAWKNGRFYFNGTDLKTIMHQVENYYNVQVEFKDDINYEFYAKVDRQINISEFLKKLELTNLVHFTIEGNKVIVRK